MTAAAPPPRALTEAQSRALDLARNTAVTAGAGSGKTTVLVARYLRAIDAGLKPREILTITYTRKAAAEMRGRIAAALAGRGPALLHDVRSAPISTIHAFCSAVLREFAPAAGVDPAFEVLEPSGQKVLAREALGETLRDRSGAPAGADPAIEAIAAVWTRAEASRALEALLQRREAARRWAEGLRAAPDEEVLARWEAQAPLDVAALLDAPGFAAIEAAAAVRADDPLAELARRVVEARSAILALPDERARRTALRRFLARGDLLTADGEGRRFGNLGSAARFGPLRDRIGPARDALAALAERLAAAGREATPDLDAAALPLLRGVADLFLDVLARYEARKLRRAALDFDDLLERTARLLADPDRPEPRRALRARFRAILLDEVQDVDPLQAEIVETLATDDAGRLLPGRLFAVGDEKQSIYRFRGADVSVFLELRERIAREGGLVAPLDENFRALEAPLRFANALFEKVFAPADGAARAEFEAAPAPLRCCRPDAAAAGPGRVELVLREETGPLEGDPETASDFAETVDEAELSARFIRRLLGDPGSGVRARDVAILIRRRTNSKLFESALRRAGIPFLVHGGIGFYGAPEVVDAANLLAFLADPRDDLALAGVLRSPFCSLTDGELYLVARQGGDPGTGSGAPSLRERLRAARDIPAAREASELLERLLALAGRLPVPELLRRALDESGAWAALAVGPRGAQALANVAKLLDVLRALEERGGAGLARLAALLGTLVDEDEWEGEADAPGEAGGGDAGPDGPLAEAPDAVRILTVHAAKGLEFPVAIVPELGAAFASEDRDPVLVEELGRRDGRGRRAYEVGVRVPDPERDGAPTETGLFRLLRRRARAKADAEARRLFYVACTRARDRLVLLGTARRTREGAPAARHSWLRMLLDAGGLDALDVIHPDELAPFAAPPAPGERGARALDALGGLGEVRPRAAPEAARPAGAAFLSPSRWRVFAACPRKYYYEAILRLPEWPEAEAGEGDPAEVGAARARARGVAIHALLEADRRAGDPGIEDEVARALGDLGFGNDRAFAAAVGAAARAALARVEASPLGALLRAAPEVRREQPFLLRVGVGEVEGRMDVLARTRGGEWLVVDWKTDEIAPEEAAAVVRARGYDRQISLYALAAARILELERVRAAIFFTSSGAVVEEIYDPRRLAAVEQEAARDIEAIAAGAFGRHAVAPCATCGFARRAACDLRDAAPLAPSPRPA